MGFKRHPNWTVFFVWLLAVAFLNLTTYFLPIEANSNIWWLVLAITIGMVWGILAWNLRVKRRSLFNMFYVLIPFIGMFIVWGMGTKEETD